MAENQNQFHYSYSAQQQEEIRRIREKYRTIEKGVSLQENKMKQLRRLDASAAKPAAAAAWTVGIAGALLLGVGMSCTMVWSDRLFVPGIVIGLIGMAGMGAAYPLYRFVTKKRREKLAPEILKLADELTGSGQGGADY